MRKLVLLCALATLLQGCVVYSYAGPYVTNVSSDADGLKVEKCRLKMNVWTAHFVNENCSTETVKQGVAAPAAKPAK